ncbi:MAG: hypothetical protein IJT36_07910 [Alphaproteobacteria bacterium]|nr:hypothetical protein [Alphaproteobacteria bacterium]
MLTEREKKLITCAIYEFNKRFTSLFSTDEVVMAANGMHSGLNNVDETYEEILKEKEEELAEFFKKKGEKND